MSNSSVFNSLLFLLCARKAISDQLIGNDLKKFIREECSDHEIMSLITYGKFPKKKYDSVNESLIWTDFKEIVDENYFLFSEIFNYKDDLLKEFINETGPIFNYGLSSAEPLLEMAVYRLNEKGFLKGVGEKIRGAFKKKPDDHPVEREWSKKRQEEMKKEEDDPLGSEWDKRQKETKIKADEIRKKGQQNAEYQEDQKYGGVEGKHGVGKASKKNIGQELSPREAAIEEEKIKRQREEAKNKPKPQPQNTQQNQQSPTAQNQNVQQPQNNQTQSTQNTNTQGQSQPAPQNNAPGLRKRVETQLNNAGTAVKGAWNKLTGKGKKDNSQQPTQSQNTQTPANNQNTQQNQQQPAQPQNTQQNQQQPAQNQNTQTQNTQPATPAQPQNNQPGFFRRTGQNISKGASNVVGGAQDKWNKMGTGGKIATGLTAAAVSAAAIYASIKIYKRFFSKAGKACKQYSGAEKNACIQNFKKQGSNAQVQSLQSALSKCNQSANPQGCQASLNARIQRIQGSMG